jgi:hypothetical protein
MLFGGVSPHGRQNFAQRIDRYRRVRQNAFCIQAVGNEMESPKAGTPLAVIEAKYGAPAIQPRWGRTRGFCPQISMDWNLRY